MTLIVATFYKFVSLPDYRQQQSSLLAFCQAHSIKGTILLAPEGINGMIAGFCQNIESVIEFLRSDPRLADLEYQESICEQLPFKRLKIRLKKEIVTLGIPQIQPSQQVGTYVNAYQWNQLLEDPQVIVIDTRNIYEVAIGTFTNALNPQIHSFSEFPDYVHHHLKSNQHQKIAMFCTGGIRCEKASSFLLKQGFLEVYQLKGGILKYLNEMPPEESLWQGECFVFDERVAVQQGLKEGSYQMCSNCGYPINKTDKTSSYYQEGIACSYCYVPFNPCG